MKVFKVQIWFGSHCGSPPETRLYWVVAKAFDDASAWARKKYAHGRLEAVTVMGEAEIAEEQADAK